MSTTALILVIFGLSIMLSRGPLVIAPTRTRAMYLKLFDTDAHMRILGVVFAVISAMVVWSVWGVSGVAAQWITYIGGFVFLLAVFAMVLMPAPFRRLATTIWSAFGPTTLRVLGLLAVLFGGWMVWYGLSL